jgi:hypothetical protein
MRSRCSVRTAACSQASCRFAVWLAALDNSTLHMARSSRVSLWQRSGGCCTTQLRSCMGFCNPERVASDQGTPDGLLDWDVFTRAHLSRSTSLFGRTMSCCHLEEESVPGKINEGRCYRAETSQNSGNKPTGSSYRPLHFTAASTASAPCFAAFIFQTAKPILPLFADSSGRILDLIFDLRLFELQRFFFRLPPLFELVPPFCLIYRYRR